MCIVITSQYIRMSIFLSQYRKTHHSLLYHSCREAVASDKIRVAKEDTMTNLADLFTKIMPKVVRERLLYMFMY